MLKNTLTNMVIITALTAVLTSCGKDNKLQGEATNSSTSSLSVNNYSNASSDFNNIIAQNNCPQYIATKKNFGFSITKNTSTPSTISFTDFNTVNFGNASNVIIGKSSMTYSGYALDQFLVMKETSTNYEFYYNLCLPNSIYYNSSVIVAMSYTSTSVPLNYSTLAGCKYNQISTTFNPTIYFDNKDIYNMNISISPIFSGLCL